MTEFPCREPGCDKPPYTLRQSRDGHEEHFHAHSPHRVWECPKDCGPLGNKYTQDALRGHLMRTHRLTIQQVELMWPDIQTRAMERVEAMRPKAAPEATPETEAPTDVEDSPDVIAKQLGIMLHDWDRTKEKLRAADSRIADLTEEIQVLRDREEPLRTEIADLRLRLARIGEEARMCLAGAGTVSAGETD